MRQRCALSDDQWAEIEGFLLGHEESVETTGRDSRFFLRGSAVSVSCGYAWAGRIQAVW